MKALSSLEKELLGRSIDRCRFWNVLDAIEHEYAPHGLSKYNIFQAVRLRFYDDGSVAHTYKEIAAFYNCSPEYARAIVKHGLRWMAHPRIAKRF